jgi:putative transposase
LDARVKFVASLIGGAKMAALFPEFDFLRKTGYKILERYQDRG